MLRLLTLPLRRFLAAVATAAVLTAPVSQLAHAEAMAEHAAGSAVMAMPMGHGGSPTKAPSHHHDASCCDFCCIGCCATLGMVPTTPATIDAAECHHVAVTTPAFRAANGPAPHFHPFSHAPPRLTA